MINIEVYYRTDCVISFDYSKHLVEIIKSIPIRTYNPNDYSWCIPTEYLELFLSKINGLPYKIRFIDKEINKDNIDKFNFKTKPFDHQKECFEFGKVRDKFLIADEQGLGKTKEVIDIAEYKKLAYDYKHCLVICGVKTLIYNWVNEIHTHSDSECYVLGQKASGKSGSNKDKLKSLEDIDTLPYYIITNIETIRDKNISNMLQKLIKENIISMVVVDEFHKVKNPNSQQCKGLMALKPFTRIALTGTPLMNNPLDLYSVLAWLDVEKHNFYAFRNHYCELDRFKRITRFKNLEELNSILNNIMIRRRKDEVLNLPPKIYTTELLEMSNEQRLIYNSVRNSIIDNIDKVEVSNNPLTQLIRLRQATGFTGILNSTTRVSCKYDRCCDIIEEVIASGGKIIVVSQWLEVINPLYDYLKSLGYDVALLTGDVSDIQRREEEARFKTNPNCKILLGTIAVMGVGLTLTVANTMVFLDSPWNKATKEQACDRCHRIGVTGTVNIITLVCKDSIDERIEEIVYSKGKISDAIVDGEIANTNKKKLLLKLLN